MIKRSIYLHSACIVGRLVAVIEPFPNNKNQVMVLKCDGSSFKVSTQNIEPLTEQFIVKS